MHVYRTGLLGKKLGMTQVFTEQGDGLSLSDEASLEVRAKSAAEILLFDLA